jgi:hypothetical protein
LGRHGRLGGKQISVIWPGLCTHAELLGGGAPVILFINRSLLGQDQIELASSPFVQVGGWLTT